MNYSEEFDLNPELHHDNESKHHLTLKEAELVFTDPYRIDEEYDEAHSEDEARYYAIGILPNGRIVKVNYTMRGEAYRLITARTATREEKRQYAEHLKLILGL